MSTPSSPLAIHSEALSCRFGRTVVVDGLDLAVPSGQVTAFLGPNGAGKTTTIRMLLGLLRPDGGRCTVLGLPPGHPKALARIGALVEYPSLYEHLSGRENVEITRLMKGAPRPETERVLALAGLARDAKRLVGEYSLGMRQRLGVALALVGNPQLLILDEPSNGLDPAGILEMRSLIRGLADQEGITVFLSSHLLAEVEQVASQVVVIDRGRLRYQGPMEAMGTREEEAYCLALDDPQRGLACLESLGFRPRLQDGHLLVPCSREAVPGLLRSLVQEGLSVYEASPRLANLEARFLNLLGAP